MLDFTWPNTLTLDQRARLSLPVPAREGHAEPDGSVSFMVGVLPEEGCIWLLTPAQFRSFFDRVQAWVGDNKAGRQLKTVMRSSFSRVSADAQGRITIPPEISSRTSRIERAWATVFSRWCRRSASRRRGVGATSTTRSSESS